MDSEPGDEHDELVNKAKELQQFIDDLRYGIEQARLQKLKPQYIEPMVEMLAKALYELADLFR